MGNRGWAILVIVSLCACSFTLAGDSNDGSGSIGDLPDEVLVSPRCGDLEALFPDVFLENRGQAPGSDVAFYAVGTSMAVGFGTGFVEYAFGDDDGTDGSVVRVLLVGAEAAEPRGLGPSERAYNFLRGRDPAGWARGVQGYQQVVYDDLWRGINLRYQLVEGRLKYEFSVAPGADVDDIRMAYQGTEGLLVDPGSGELLIRTPVGTLRDNAPWSYQEVGGRMRPVETGYRIGGGDTVGFSVADHDAMSTLVIDPDLDFSTFVGGTYSEYLWDMAVDDNGSVYVTGYTTSSDYPVTNGAYCSTLDGGKDIFVTKLSSDGSSLNYSTFLGGSNQDEARGIAIDSSGSAFIAGSTLSQDYPVTSGANQTTYGGSVDMVVTKLAANGSAILWATYVGGSMGDFAFDIRVDSKGAVYVGGYSGGSFPTTTGAFDTSHNSKQDGVMLKLSADGSTLVYSTYIGGSWDDYIYGIAVDSHGNAYATGFTGSANTTFPVTSGAFCETEVDGDDGFVLRLNATGSGLLWCGFISGSTSGTAGWCVDVDQSGNAYVAGDTKVADLPVTNSSYDSTLGGTRDAFVAKIDVNGSYYRYLTYLGGSLWEYIYDIDVDAKGRAHLTGRTFSTDYPTTADAYDSSFNYGSNDVLYTVLNRYGSGLEYSTYVGSDDDDQAWGVHVSSSGEVTLAGWTESTTFPTTAGAYCTTLSGDQDGFVLRFVPSQNPPPEFWEDSTPPSASVGTRMTFGINITDDTRVKNASVEYWYGNGSHYSRSLTRTSGTVQNGTWTYNYYPRGTLDPLYYMFHATDEDDQSNNTTARMVALFDDWPPYIDDYTPYYNWPDGATTGDPFKFVANVSDAIAVADVWIEYGFEGAGNVNTSMDPWYVYGNGQGTYVLNLTLPWNVTGTIHYTIFATDTSDNTNSIDGWINVTDNDGPALGPDTSDTGATTGDVLHLMVDVTDNWGVGSVWVNYWFETGPMVNRSMDPVTVDAGGNGTYSYDLTVPTDYTGPIWYSFLAMDVSDIWNDTLDRRVDSVDDDPPQLGPDASHEGEDTYVFEVDAFDNVGIVLVWVEYTVTGEPAVNLTMDPLQVEANGNGTYGSVEVPVSQVEQVRIDYVIGARDAAGNVVTLAGSYVNIDLEVPWFGEDGTQGEPVKGWDITIWVEVWDNLGLADVRLVHWFGDGGETNSSMTDEGGTFNLTIPLPRWPGGDLHYRFEAVDLKGNWNHTTERRLVLVNRVPDVTETPEWTVTEDQVGVLDLVPYLFDENDDVEDLTLSTEAEGITVQGLRLSALYHDWMGDHTIQVSVTDGEDTTEFSIHVTVINVNGDPEFTSIPSIEGEVGTAYTYEVEYTDPDPEDVLTLTLATAPDGMTLVDGTVEWVPVAGQTGEHTVVLELGDGTTTVTQEWTITVTVRFNTAPVFINSPPLAHDAGDHYEWEAEAEDAEDDALTFTLVDGPEGAAMDASTGVLTWDPPADKRDRTDQVEFTVRVSDGVLHADKAFTVALRYPVNQAPEVVPGLGEMRITKDLVVNLTEYMYDPDDPTFALHWTAETDSDLFTVRMDGFNLVIEPKPGVRGEGTVTLRLYDPWGLVDTQQVTVSVDTKERDVEQSWCSSFWWIAIILLVVALLVLYLTRDRWLPEEEAPEEGEAEGETELRPALEGVQEEGPPREDG